MYKNILITNLKDRYCYRFDKDQGQFVTATKADVLEELIENRIGDLEAIYDEFATANKIDQKTRRLIQTFLDKLAEDNVQYTDDTAVYPSYRDYKKHNIKILLYKNKDRTTRDIALLIGERISTLEDDPFAFAIEASMAKTTTKPAAKKTVAKPAAKKVVAKVAAKPVAKKAVAKPAAKKVVAKPVAKKAVAKPAAKKVVAKMAAPRKGCKK